MTPPSALEPTGKGSIYSFNFSLDVFAGLALLIGCLWLFSYLLLSLDLFSLVPFSHIQRFFRATNIISPEDITQ